MPVQPTGAPQRELLPSLTGLRFWAALLVVLYHLSRQYHRLPWISQVVWYGRDGVTFFFVLSGFVLAWSYAGTGTANRAGKGAGSSARVRTRVFYWRRFARIWPLHVVATGIALAVATAPPKPGALLTLPLLQAWYRGTASLGNPASWSLSAEAWFYLLFPALLPFLLRRSDRALRRLLVVACGLALLLWPVGALVADPSVRAWMLDYLPLSRTPQFLVGAVAGICVRRGMRVPVRTGWVVGALLLWHLALLLWNAVASDTRWYGPYSASQMLVTPLFALLVVAAAQRDLDGPPSRLGRPWARRLGHWSFAWYLVHQSCLLLVQAMFGRPHDNTEALAGWLLVAAVSLPLAGALYHWVERPAEAWLRGRGPGRGPVPDTAKPGPGVTGARLPAHEAAQSEKDPKDQGVSAVEPSMLT